LGVNIKIASKVVEYHAETASVTTETGEKHFGDLVVAVDGKHVKTQQSL